jgi:hypothetical protein
MSADNQTRAGSQMGARNQMRGRAGVVRRPWARPPSSR